MRGLKIRTYGLKVTSEHIQRELHKLGYKWCGAAREYMRHQENCEWINAHPSGHTGWDREGPYDGGFDNGLEEITLNELIELNRSGDDEGIIELTIG